MREAYVYDHEKWLRGLSRMCKKCHIAMKIEAPEMAALAYYKCKKCGRMELV